MSLTIRQTMAKLMRSSPLTARDMASALLLTTSQVERHLGHLQKTHKAKLRMEPAECRACGYVFSDRRRLDAPGRCPLCKQQRVEGPWFALKE